MNKPQIANERETFGGWQRRMRETAAREHRACGGGRCLMEDSPYNHYGSRYDCPNRTRDARA